MCYNGLPRAGRRLTREAANRDQPGYNPREFSMPLSPGTWSLERLGRDDDAIAALRNAVRVSAENPVMQAGLGIAYLRVDPRLDQLPGDPVLEGLLTHDHA